MNKKYLALIEHSHVYDAAVITPLTLAKGLSDRTENRVFLKREDLQPVFSFKIRGAYNKIASLSVAEQQRGVIAASAGNHAQGVAFSAQKLGINAQIVMPETTPNIKIDAVRSYGADVILFGESYSDAAQHAQHLSDAADRVYIHPFDDPHVIAGQGTIAKEIVEQFTQQHSKQPDLIFVCIGGGGLAAGIATYIKAKAPNVKVVGVQANDSDAMARSINAGHRVTLEEVGIFADGVAVKQVGEETFRLCQAYLDDIITVSTDEICAAIKDAFDDTRSILEPAGALAIAGAKKYLKQHQLKNKDIIATASGANVNFDRLRHVSERTEFAERREAILAVTLSEQAGSFRQFCETLGKRSITEFNYRFNHTRRAQLYVGVNITNKEDLSSLIGHLNMHGYPTIDLSDNEMAKLHVRHLIGGQAPSGVKEVLYRFQFPEKPGALLNFLCKLSSDWNISLFHYRNHGADFGRVLCGLQIPPAQQIQFQHFLDHLGYLYVDETDNHAAKLFLN